MSSWRPDSEPLPPGAAYARALSEVRGFTVRMISSAEASVDLTSDRLLAVWVGRTVLATGTAAPAEPVQVTVNMQSSLFSGQDAIEVSVAGEQTAVTRNYVTGRNILLSDYGSTTSCADMVVRQAVGGLGLAAFDHQQAGNLLMLQESNAN